MYPSITIVKSFENFFLKGIFFGYQTAAYKNKLTPFPIPFALLLPKYNYHLAIDMASTTSWSSDLFGQKILKKPKTSGVSTSTQFKGKKITLIYFSASW